MSNTYFVPQEYATLDALRKAYYFAALSNATIEGKDIFGWVDGTPFKCNYFYNEIQKEEVVIAGDRFEDEEPATEDEEPATEEQYRRWLTIIDKINNS